MSQPFSLFDSPDEVKRKNIEPRIEESWKKVLHDEFQKPYFLKLKEFLLEEQKAKHKVYPPSGQIFHAFDLCPFQKVKVVIIGQDPYHGTGQAHGLCFSVNKNISPPPSLQNIYKEIHTDLKIPIPPHGNLEAWAGQGVLLLNATLTVRHRSPTSHSSRGWEQFTDRVIKELSDKREGIVFLLWGRYAQGKGKVIDQSKHFILTAAHPSPFSASNGFFGCKHFSRTNELLLKAGKTSIDWSVD